MSDKSDVLWNPGEGEEDLFNGDGGGEERLEREGGSDQDI